MALKLQFARDAFALMCELLSALFVLQDTPREKALAYWLPDVFWQKSQREDAATAPFVSPGDVPVSKER